MSEIPKQSEGFEQTQREVEDFLFNHLDQAMDAENYDDLVDVLDRVMNESKSFRQKLLSDIREEKRGQVEVGQQNDRIYQDSHYIEYQGDVFPA